MEKQKKEIEYHFVGEKSFEEVLLELVKMTKGTVCFAIKQEERV